jgi:ribosomal-protein-alanine N-acetyltransferase
LGADTEILTSRLRLRRWRRSDREPFARMNADPAVMEHFPAALTREQSDDLIERIEAGFERDGFGLWALEVIETGDFVGFTGLSVPAFEAHFTPAVEVGWRLARPAWGNGYATEAGRAALELGFSRARIEQIVSFATLANVRSRAVMKRLAMSHDPSEDFDHPDIPAGHPQRRHALYRSSAAPIASRSQPQGRYRRS